VKLDLSEKDKKRIERLAYFFDCDKEVLLNKLFMIGLDLLEYNAQVGIKALYQMREDYSEDEN